MKRVFSWFAVSSSVCVALSGLSPATTATASEPVPDYDFRKPTSDEDLRYWLQNMVWDHRFSVEEIEAATGMSKTEIEAALKRFDIRPENRPARAKDTPLKMVPWPGGRAISDWPEIEPSRQRETKATVFAPWDDSSYIVLDAPEAIFSNIGVLYLAHIHVPTYWTERNITLEKLEWKRQGETGLEMERKLPNGVEYSAKFLAYRRAIRMKITLTNGTDATLTGLRVQNCIFLKGMKGMENEAKPKVVVSEPYTAYGTADGERWVVTAWIPFHRCWNNPANPCFHSDPKFPDCAPGKTESIYGWVSFYEGKDVEEEFKRIEGTGWREDLWKDQPNWREKNACGSGAPAHEACQR